MLGEVAISSRARSSLGKSDAGLSGACCPQDSQHPWDMLELQLVVGRSKPQEGFFLQTGRRRGLELPIPGSPCLWRPDSPFVVDPET